jgi:hypothetical protein
MDLRKLVNKGMLWFVVAALLLSLTAFAAALVWTYVADEMFVPALNEASYPPPTNTGR